MNVKCRVFIGAICLLLVCISSVPAATVSGELKVWHKVTISFDGPQTSEQATPNPFTDYRLTVTFTGPSGQRYTVPGYYAADGNAAETSADSGDQWRAHLAPDEAGVWTYDVSFRNGSNVAVSDEAAAGKPVAGLDGVTGTFVIEPTDKTAPDFRGKGRLDYVGARYLRFAGSGEYFLKCGPDAPETFLAYKEFDGTEGRRESVPLKSWQPHAKDWNAGDPTWKDGKGKGIIGAVNYLAGKGLNSISFITYNAGADGDNVWPFRDRDDKFRYDCSKLDQWQIVLDHAQAKGLYLHFKTQETENDDHRLFEHDGRVVEQIVPESLDGGQLGPERKLYYRELIARFSYELALNWNLGEENSQTTEQQQAMAAYFAKHDPYRHHIVIHTWPGHWEKVYTPLLGDGSDLTGVSLQNHWGHTHELTLQWLKASAAAGKPWVVANDEQNPFDKGVPPDTGYKGFDPKDAGYDMHDIRKDTLWGNLMAGGAGVEYYFGGSLPQNDMLCEDYRSRDKSWEYGRIALEFFKGQNIPFWEMANDDGLLSGADGYCFRKPGEVYVVFLKAATGGKLKLPEGDYSVRWYNPRTGGDLQTGSVKTITGGDTVSLGNPPTDPEKDWALLIKKK